MTIGVSTMAFGQLKREEIVSLALKYNWLIEFSSSFPHQEDMSMYFENLEINRLAHNYFPAPAQPFVLNLASTNPEIREKSVAHCLQGLRLTKACGGHFFSAHAGFCIDPTPEQLGHNLNVELAIDREKNWILFKESIRQILKRARELDVSFLVENNVTSTSNLRSDGQEILLCTSPDEMRLLVHEMNDLRFGLLLDTAHLKVSARSLDFDPDRAVELVGEYVKYIHHSDNDGTRDSNDSIDINYWFLPHMMAFTECIHVLEVKNISVSQIQRQIKLLSNYDKN